MSDTRFTDEDQQVMKSKTKHPFLRLLKYGIPQTGWFLLGLAIILMVTAIELYQPVILADAVDGFVASKDVSGVIWCGVIYGLSIVAEFALTYLQWMILVTASQRIIFALRKDLFGHLTRLHVGFFNDNPVGRLVTRVTNDCETVNQLFSEVIVFVLKGAFVLVGVMAMMISYHALLSLYIFIVIPIIVAATWMFTVGTRKIYRRMRAMISELNGFVAERIMGMEVVQTYGEEADVDQDFQDRTEELRKVNMRQLMAFAFYSPISYVTNIIALGILIVVGGHMAIEGAVTIGTLVAFQRYISKFFQPIADMAEQFNTIQSAMACSERIFWLLDTEPQVENQEDAVSLEGLRGEIEFRNVWFAYKDEDWVLRDVTFRVAPGQRVAFVGATGAGKTTIQSLICRYYDIQKGQILIDGIDIRRIRLEDLRGNIGEMLQDVFLFSGNVRDNIRLNELSITDEQVKEAAETVNASAFIEALPDQYDHTVIERGAAFSAGQRQLLSFARTLASRPSVLILDEATANIDTDTEILIQEALGRLMEGRTTLIVAHRLSTIRDVDNIIVLDHGRIVEEGDHQSLLAQHGVYYKLYQLSLKEGEIE